MIDFFAHIGLAVIGAVTLLVAFALVLLALLYIAMLIDDWWRHRRYRSLQRYHDLRIEK